LQIASDWYLRGPVEDNEPKSAADPSDCPLGVPLPRDKNLNQVEATFGNTLTKWLVFPFSNRVRSVFGFRSANLASGVPPDFPLCDV
jgi:hypothetical protein